MMDVLNTVEPGIIIKTLKEMKEKREQKEIEDCPILMSNYFKLKLDGFVSITTNERLTGIGNIIDSANDPSARAQIAKSVSANPSNHNVSSVRMFIKYYKPPNPS